ncbi:hypothetical protein GN956_G13110 [Arapaima gigas]
MRRAGPHHLTSPPFGALLTEGALALFAQLQLGHGQDHYQAGNGRAPHRHPSLTGSAGWLDGADKGIWGARCSQDREEDKRITQPRSYRPLSAAFHERAHQKPAALEHDANRS